MLWLFDFVVVVFSTSLSAVGNSGGLTCIRHSSCKKSSATHSYQCVRYFPVSRQCYGCHCLGLLTCAQMLKHANAPGIVQTPRSARTKTDSGRRKKQQPCRTGDSNPRQYCARLFSRTLYQLIVQVSPCKQTAVYHLLCALTKRCSNDERKTTGCKKEEKKEEEKNEKKIKMKKEEE